MPMDLYFLILSTCLHAMSGGYYATKMCQERLTTCHDILRVSHKKTSDEALVSFCLIHEISLEEIYIKSRKE